MYELDPLMKSLLRACQTKISTPRHRWARLLLGLIAVDANRDRSTLPEEALTRNSDDMPQIARE